MRGEFFAITKFTVNMAGLTNVRTVKVSCVRWLDHLYREANAFPTKKVTFLKIEGTRHRRRSPTQWLDDIEKDFKLMEIN
ncbi:hypothetical protein TNCV_4660981 [Trichonephila clavipes]|uniref:Uncharacterized protein n=1 Tax=Trichonephila clavipes TaxID=2585209 RepID=A0A8X6S9D0_TRICX|nr:hypothetical protein TNCV_4660981 [Trichonephila clavipes]